MSDTKPQMQEAQRTPSSVYAKKLHLGISNSHFRELKIKKKFGQRPEGKNKQTNKQTNKNQLNLYRSKDKKTQHSQK